MFLCVFCLMFNLKLYGFYRKENCVVSGLDYTARNAQVATSQLTSCY